MSKGFVLFYTMVSGIVVFCALMHRMILTPAIIAECKCIYRDNDSKYEDDDLLDRLTSRTSASFDTMRIIPIMTRIEIFK